MSISPIVLYNQAFLELFDGTIDWNDAANVAAVLCTADYVPELTHTTYNDLTNEVATGGEHDYEPKAVGTRTTVRDGDEIQYKSAAVSWGANVTISARYLVLVLGNPASLATSDKLIGYVDFGEAKASTDSTFSYTPPATGWFRVSRA